MLNAHQLRLLGIGWPPKKGWIQSLIGREISEETFQLLMELRGVSKKSERNKILLEHGVDAGALFQTKLSI